MKVIEMVPAPGVVAILDAQEKFPCVLEALRQDDLPLPGLPRDTLYLSAASVEQRQPCIERRSQVRTDKHEDQFLPGWRVEGPQIAVPFRADRSRERCRKHG